LKALDAQYSPEREFINNIKRQILNKDGSTLKDNAASTILNLVGKNKGQKLSQFEKLTP
jgi:hypothetical protein